MEPRDAVSRKARNAFLIVYAACCVAAVFFAGLPLWRVDGAEQTALRFASVCLAVLLLGLVLAAFAWTLFWTIPRDIVARRYSARAPRRAGIAYVGGGMLLILLSGTIALFAWSYGLSDTRILTRVVIVTGIVGAVAVVQGIGVLLFRSKALGVIGAIFALVVIVLIQGFQCYQLVD